MITPQVGSMQLEHTGERKATSNHIYPQMQTPHSIESHSEQNEIDEIIKILLDIQLFNPLQVDSETRHQKISHIEPTHASMPRSTYATKPQPRNTTQQSHSLLYPC